MTAPAPSPSRAKKPEKKKKTVLQEIASWVRALVAAVVIVALLDAFVAQVIRVDGTSMEKMLHDGEVVLVSKLGGAYQRGDIVICRYPNRTDGSFDLGANLAVTRHTVFVKRLVALPGDSVEIRNGKLYVNDELVPDPASLGSTPRDYSRRVLGEDEYFVVGDNRFSSHDSRAADVGPISGDMLRGKVKCVIWPLNAIRGVN